MLKKISLIFFVFCCLMNSVGLNAVIELDFSQKLNLCLNIIKNSNSKEEVVEAQYEIAIIYSLGDKNIIKNYAKALKWFQAVIDNPNSNNFDKMDSQLCIADLYRVGGNKIGRDDAKAINYYTALINNRSNENVYILIGKTNIAEIYFFGGNNVVQNYTAALKYFNEIDNILNSDSVEIFIAKYYLGVMYQNGYGVTKDITKASDYFAKALIGFNNFLTHPVIASLSNYYLGQMYINGYGVTKNVSKALRYFKKVTSYVLWPYQQAQMIINAK